MSNLMSELIEIRDALSRMKYSTWKLLSDCKDSSSNIQKWVKRAERVKLAGVDSSKLDDIEDLIMTFGFIFQDISEAHASISLVYDEIRWIIDDESREIFKRLIQATTSPKEYMALCKENGVDVKKLAERFDLLSDVIISDVIMLDDNIKKIMERAGIDSSKPEVIESMIERFKSLYEIISEDDEVPSLDKEKKEV